MSLSRLGLLLVLATLCNPLFAQGDTGREIRVSVKEAPPFAMKNAAGEWTGLSVEMWKRIAASQNWRTRWQESQSADQQITQLATRDADVAVGALSMTAAREDLMDFSHPFYVTGLAIATPIRDGGVLSMLKPLVSLQFLSAIGVLVLLLLGVGFAVWLLERHKNPAQFGGSLTRGIGNGFWWSAVTMTTVGYGDKAPVTTAGRTLATVWMFVSIITISSFTAAIASSVTLYEARGAVGSVADLARVKTLAVDGTTATQALASQGIVAESVSTLNEGLQRLKDNKATALVYDKALMMYTLKDWDMKLELLDYPGTTQEYALGLQSGSPLREIINRQLLAFTGSPDWRALVTQTFEGS